MGDKLSRYPYEHEACLQREQSTQAWSHQVLTHWSQASPTPQKPLENSGFLQIAAPNARTLQIVGDTADRSHRVQASSESATAESPRDRAAAAWIR